MENSKEILIFCKKLTIFLIPLIFFYSLPLTIIISSEENTPILKIIERQNKEKVLLGLSYSDPGAYFKLQSVLYKNQK